MKRRILKPAFFRRSPHKVAPELLGNYLVCRSADREQALVINEVEIYDGEKDEACHAHKGRTQRTEVMFAPGGLWYVYLIYGMYDMLNIVVSEKDKPAAILIRGAEDLDGPGKLTKALRIDRSYNSKQANKDSGLWIEDRGLLVPKKQISRTPRIGIDYASEPWRSKKWRFLASL